MPTRHHEHLGYTEHQGRIHHAWRGPDGHEFWTAGDSTDPETYRQVVGPAKMLTGDGLARLPSLPGEK